MILKVERKISVSYLLITLALLFGGVQRISSIFFHQDYIAKVTLSLSFLFFLTFLFSIFYNIYTYRRFGFPKEIWKLGWIGFVGLIGFIPYTSPVLILILCMFGFFAFKQDIKRSTRYFLVSAIVVSMFLLNFIAVETIGAEKPNLFVQYAFVVLSLVAISTLACASLKRANDIESIQKIDSQQRN